jgi:hypothetical protein
MKIMILHISRARSTTKNYRRTYKKKGLALAYIPSSTPYAIWTLPTEGAMQIIKVNKAKEYRGKRARWFKLLTLYDGKDVDLFLKSDIINEETPRGYLTFFLRDGGLQLKQVPGILPPHVRSSQSTQGAEANVHRS